MRRTLVSDRERASERASKQARLTDGTPSWSKIADVVMPYNPVDEDDQVAEENPTNVEDSASIACTKMGWGG